MTRTHTVTKRAPRTRTTQGCIALTTFRKSRFNPVCGWTYAYGESIELTNPTEYVGDTAGDFVHARRFNPEDGYMNRGNGTWVRIPDGDLDQLLAAVEIWAGMHNSACDPGN